MVAVLIILILLLLIAGIIATITIRFRLHLRWDPSGMNAEVLGLPPFFRAVAWFEYGKPYLSIYILKLRVFEKQLKNKPGKKNGMRMIQSVKPKDIEASVQYGLNDPFTTGISCGVLGAVTSIFHVKRISYLPDFMADEPYIYADASANINIGETITNFIRNKA